MLLQFSASSHWMHTEPLGTMEDCAREALKFKEEHSYQLVVWTLAMFTNFKCYIGYFDDFERQYNETGWSIISLMHWWACANFPHLAMQTCLLGK